MDGCLGSYYFKKVFCDEMSASESHVAKENN
jgi:hypothetical protein